MIEDLLFKKLEFPAAADFGMKLLPPESASLRASSGRGLLTQKGTMARHEFSISDQPLTAAEVRHISELYNESKGRCVLFKNPYMHRVELEPTANKFGSFTGGCFIRPQGATFWQPAQYFTNTNLDKVAFRPVVYAENITLETQTITPVYDFLTKQGNSEFSLEGVNTSASVVEFAAFDYWLAVRITQFERVPLRERRLNTTCDSDSPEYLVSLVLEEDPSVSLPVFFSWASDEQISYSA